MFAEKLNANGDPKLNAAADFAARLLNGPLGERIERIILFGSVATGDATLDSDVDVMVFGDAPTETLQSAVADAAFDAMLEDGVELVSPIAFSLDELQCPSHYLTYNVLQNGREIFARHPQFQVNYMDETTMRLHEARGLYNKALGHWEEAQRGVEHGLFTSSTVLAYTAGELAARALIILRPNRKLPSTHEGTLQIFSLEYVKTGAAPARWAEILKKDLNKRNWALYVAARDMTAADAQPMIEFAREILDFLKRKLEETESDNAN